MTFMDATEARAWELLEAECGKPLPFDVPTHAALSAIRAALSQQPESRDVVDEESCRSVIRQLLHWDGVPVHVTGTVTTSPGNWALIDTLGTKQQEPAACKHDFRRDEDHGGACCQMCGEVRQ